MKYFYKKLRPIITWQQANHYIYNGGVAEVGRLGKNCVETGIFSVCKTLVLTVSY